MQSFVRISVSTSASHALEPGSIPGRSIPTLFAIGLPTHYFGIPLGRFPDSKHPNMLWNDPTVHKLKTVPSFFFAKVTIIEELER